MITTIVKNIIPAALLLLLLSCNGKTDLEDRKRKTIDIQGLNLDIKKTIGIDLLLYKSKIDKRFPSDSFYVEVCEELLFESGESIIHNEFGSILTFDNGDSIKYAQRDSLFASIFHSIGNNFYLDDCEGKEIDTTYCQMKKKAHESLQSVAGVMTLTVSNTIGDIYDRFRQGYFNYDELAFFVVVHHLLRDIYMLEN